MLMLSLGTNTKIQKIYRLGYIPSPPELNLILMWICGKEKLRLKYFM